MSQDFSDAPLTVDGITVRPDFPWSTNYRAHVAAQMREGGTSHLPASEREDRYVEWYADANGLTLEQARERIMEAGE